MGARRRFGVLRGDRRRCGPQDAFVEGGGQIDTCLPCFKKRELDENDLVPGAVIVGGPKLVAFMAEGAPGISY